MKKINLSIAESVIFVCILVAIAATQAYSATYTVTTTADNNTCSSGNCSLRGAINAANSNPGPDIINFSIPSSDPGCSLGVCTITLTLGQLIVDPFSTAGQLTITNASGNQRIEISGNNSSRVFANFGRLTLNSLTIRDGRAAFDFGGGIFNFAGARLSVVNSTIINNSCDYNGGGIINNNTGVVSITNSTIRDNSAFSGGGIANLTGGTITITHTTISNNGATNIGGGIYNDSASVVYASNNIVANNSAGGGEPDFSGPINSSGYNLIENTAGLTGNFPQIGDISGVDPLLGPLGYYGGLSWTLPLMNTSPAADAGSSPVITDQRGASRPAGLDYDIGAYEINDQYIAILPNGQADTPYGPFTITPNNEGCTMSMTGLPSGLSLTQSGNAYQITGTPTVTGTYTATLTINCGGNTTTVTYQIFIAAPSAASVSISGRVFGSDGRGLRNAYVILTDDQGQSRSVQTSAFGYYRFDEVEAGRTYTVTVQSKRYTYETRVLFVIDDINDLDFYPLN